MSRIVSRWWDLDAWSLDRTRRRLHSLAAAGLDTYKESQALVDWLGNTCRELHRDPLFNPDRK